MRPHDTKHFIHPDVGALELHCQTLLDPQQSHSLFVYTAVPGSESYDKLQLLSVIGSQTVRSDLQDGTVPGAGPGRSAGR